MRVLLLIGISFLFFNSSYAQINAKGYDNLLWGTPKNTLINLRNCSSNQAGDEFENCQLSFKDSLFLKKYKYSYSNLRFYQGSLVEVDFDLRHEDLAAIVSSLSTQFGKPLIKENKTRSADPMGNIIGYEWVIGDTKVLLLNKGPHAPAWCTIASVSQKKKYIKKLTVDIEQLIFD